MVFVDDGRQAVDQRADIDAADALPRVLGDELRNVGLQPLALGRGRRCAEVPHRLGDGLRIAMHRCEEQVLDGLAQIVVQPLDHAAIEHSHDAIGQEHEVPGMRIRVVKAITEDHLQVHVRAAPRELVHLRVRTGEYLDLRHERALESLHGQDAS